MAHKLDYSKGQAAFISYQEAAWHGLGKVFNQEITVENALHEAGLDFQVCKAPNIHRIAGQPDIISDSSFFTYRTDTNKVLGDKLGNKYTVYQNTQALAVVDEMLKTGKVKIETAGAVEDGRRVFVCLKMQNPIIVNSDDEVEQYVLLSNGHDGTLAITAMPTNVRVVCWNTLSAALAGAKPHHKIRHTTNAERRVKEAFEIMGLLEDSTKANTAAYRAMASTSLTKEEFFDYIGNIFLDADDIAELQKGNRDALSNQKRATMGGVMNYAETGPGQKLALGNNLNMWYAMNAATGYITSDEYKSADARFDSMIFGSGAAKIKAAGELALSPHAIKPLRATAGGNIMLN